MPDDLEEKLTPQVQVFSKTFNGIFLGEIVLFKMPFAQGCHGSKNS